MQKNKKETNVIGGEKNKNETLFCKRKLYSYLQQRPTWV